MAIKLCRECGHQVSTEAPTCPKCGVPEPGRPLAEGETVTPEAKVQALSNIGCVVVIVSLAILVLMAVVLLVVYAVSGDEDYETPRAIANELGCTGFDDSSNTPGADLLADGPASCQYQGARVVLVVGRDGDSRDRIIAGSQANGAAALTGGNWAVLSNDRSALLAAQDVLGGDLP